MDDREERLHVLEKRMLDAARLCARLDEVIDEMLAEHEALVAEAKTHDEDGGDDE